MEGNETRCNVCGGPIEDRGYKHAQCPRCGQISGLCCDPEIPCGVEENVPAARDGV